MIKGCRSPMITRWPVPAAVSSPNPATGQLIGGRVADLCPYLNSVPDPRARRGPPVVAAPIPLVRLRGRLRGERSRRARLESAFTAK